MRQSQKWSVAYYVSAGGNAPAEEFIKGLLPQRRAELLRLVRLLSEFGPTLKEPYVVCLGQGLWELRSRYAALIYCVQAMRRCIILCGYVRKGPTTPLQELNRALALRADWLVSTKDANEE